MSVPLVTEASVHAAADAIKKEGKIAVSYRSIRGRLGGGSFRDIQRHLDTWWAKQAARPSAADAATAAAEVQKLMSEAIIKIEAAFQRRLNSEVDRLREEFESGSRVARAQLDGAADDTAALQDEVDGLNAMLADTRAKLEAEQQNALSLASTLAEERVQRSILQAVSTTTELRVHDLKETQSSLQKELQTEREVTVSLRERERLLRDECEQARSAAGAAQRQVADLLAKEDATSRQLQEAQARFKADLDGGARKVQELQAALAVAREHAARLEGELAGARKQRDEPSTDALPDMPVAAKGKAVLAGAKANAR